MKSVLRASSFVLLIVLLGLLFTHQVVYSQEQQITPETAAKFIGEQKTVCGTVASAHYAAKSKGQPTFLNLDKPYPGQIFTAVIWGSDRGKFEKPPEVLYSGKKICVTGTITSYQGKPQIIVKDPSQIKAQ